MDFERSQGNFDRVEHPEGGLCGAEFLRRFGFAIMSQEHRGERNSPIRIAEALLLIFLVARLALVLITIAWPSRAVLVDSQGYIFLADSIISGEYRSNESPALDFTRPPGYPAFVASIWALLGRGNAAVIFFQLLLGSAASWLLYVIGTRLGSRTLGLGAAWLLAVSPNHALWSLTVLSEVLYMAIIALAALAWLISSQQGSGWKMMVSGILIGLATLTRPIGVYLIPLWLGLAMYAIWRRAGAKRAIILGALFLMGCGVICIPWAYRNLEVHGRFAISGVASHTLSGFNLAYAVAEAEGIGRSQAASILGQHGSIFQRLRWVARTYPGSLIRVELMGIARTLAGNEIASWIQMIDGSKRASLGIFSAIRESRWHDLAYNLQHLAEGHANQFVLGILALSLAHSIILIALAGLGAQRLCVDRGMDAAFFALVAITAAYHIVAPLAAGQARFRVPAEPFIAILAAKGLAGFLNRSGASNGSADNVKVFLDQIND